MAPKPWLAHYDTDVKHSLAPYPDSTLLDYLDRLARHHGSKAALLFKGSEISYRQLDLESSACAAALWQLGVRPGDRVALFLPNCPQFMIAEFGAWKIGAIVVAVNPTYTEREIENVLQSTRTATVVVLTPFYERIKRVQSSAGVTRIIVTSIKEYLSPALRVLFTLFKEKKDGHRISIQDGDLWLRDLLHTHKDASRPSVQVKPDDRAVILSSGGTTGTPKGVVGLHRHYVAAGLQLFEWTKSAKQPWDVIMLPLPLFHVYGNVGVQAMAFVGPNPLSLIPNPRDITDLLKTIRKVKPAFLNGVPTMYSAILNHPKVRAGKIDLRSIKLCICGAAALMAETRRRFEQQTGAVMLEGYSLTEAMMACCVNPVHGESKIGSIGMPLPDVEARIVDAEDGSRDLPTGEVGELLLRAPQLMLEYWDNPLETSETLRTYGDGGPWLHTGDLAYLDSEGYIFLVDRKKDMVKTSGFQVWPREIEEVISAHPSVQEVGVAGIPDAVKGEVAKAWVVLRAGRTATEDELRAYCRERLAPYKVPAHVEFRTDLPKSMIGKVLRRVLAAEARGS
ncbi:MAG TPA: long-chain fatty acid--CoA ligase [Vicinamibacterales bacterium]|jgi:long-chain acyl-CoA synthetase